MNKIVFPSDYKKLAYVEMTTDLNYQPFYTGSTFISVLGYDSLSDSTYFIRYGGNTRWSTATYATTTERIL